MKRCHTPEQEHGHEPLTPERVCGLPLNVAIGSLQTQGYVAYKLRGDDGILDAPPRTKTGKFGPRYPWLCGFYLARAELRLKARGVLI